MKVKELIDLYGTQKAAARRLAYLLYLYING